MAESHHSDRGAIPRSPGRPSGPPIAGITLLHGHASLRHAGARAGLAQIRSAATTRRRGLVAAGARGGARYGDRPRVLVRAARAGSKARATVEAVLDHAVGD